MEFFPRGIEDKIRRLWASMPVVVLEGGRAVGKTTLCRQLQQAELVRDLVDLTDPAARSAAEDDPFAFVARLSTPAVIDEAQMVPNISLAVKQTVDAAGRAGLFILTGSTTLGRGLLHGSDPLAGRAVRLRLTPFTQGERAGTPIDLVQNLRKGDLVEHRTERPASIEERLLVGGMPGMPGVIRPGSPAARREAVEAYVEAVVQLTTTTSRADRARLLDLFRVIAGTPALILNNEKLASDFGLSPTTLRSYLHTLEDGFLLDAVPALANDARREVKGHPRLVPSDVSLAAWAGRHSGETLRANPTSMGPLLHALVINELMAQGSWAENADVCHWRDRNDEVDVVVRYPDGSKVPVEIKAARVVSRHDARNLQLFRRRTGQPSIGVLFYLGNRSYELEPGVWALPVQALWEPGFAAERTAEIPASPTAAPSATEPAAGRTFPSTRRRASDDTAIRASDAALFLSYVHEDNRVMNGRIVQLAQAIDDHYRFLTGETLEVFTDRDLNWGDQWRARIDEQLARTTFFVPVVTPRFLQSEECRRETQAFLAAAKGVGAERQYVLPIFLVAPESLDDDDPLAATLKTYHGSAFEDLIYEDPGSSTYRREVNRLAKELVKAVRQRATAPSISKATSGAAESTADILQLMEQTEGSMTALPSLLSRYQEALEATMVALNGSMSDIQTAEAPRSPSEFRRALRRVAAGIREPVEELDRATADVEAALATVDNSITGLIRLGSSNEGALPGIQQMLSQLGDDVPDGLGIDPAQVATIRGQMNMLGRLAAEMRAPARSLERAVLLVSDVDAMLRRWRRDTERFSR